MRISDCRGDSDLGLRSSWHLAQRIPQRSGWICFIWGICRNFEPIRALRGGILCARCQELHRRQARSSLQIDIRNLIYISTKKKLITQRLLFLHMKARSADRDRN